MKPSITTVSSLPAVSVSPRLSARQFEVLATPSSPRLPDARRDAISIENAAFLRAELDRQPEIRPEVVARARALAADPAYPPMEALRAVASQILRSPDLSEDRS